MQTRDLNVRMLDTALGGTDKNTVVVDRSKERTLYKVWVYLDGPDLPYVAKVTYELHRTFARNRRGVSRTSRNPQCRLAIWTWGVFTVHALVEDKFGNTYELRHRLSYDKEIHAKGITFKPGKAPAEGSSKTAKRKAVKRRFR